MNVKKNEACKSYISRFEMVNLLADSELLSDLRWECGHRPKSWRSHPQYSDGSLRFFKAPLTSYYTGGGNSCQCEKRNIQR